MKVNNCRHSSLAFLALILILATWINWVTVPVSSTSVTRSSAKQNETTSTASEGGDRFLNHPPVPNAMPACPTITFNPTSLPGDTAGAYYSQNLSAFGGNGTYTPSVSSGTLPPGLSLSYAGNLAGIPTTAGTFNFTVTMVDNISGCTGSQAYTVAIQLGLKLGPDPGSALPNATVGTPYNQTITAVGGTAPYTFTTSNGSPPPGLTLSSSGVLSGTPTSANPTTFFTITTTDSAGHSGSQNNVQMAVQNSTSCTLSVTTTADSGNGSLRSAINCANQHANSGGPDTITFAIPGSGKQTISLASPLPGIVDPVIIDGYTQPASSANTTANGDNANILIELNGSGLGFGNGLVINTNGGGSTVRGLIVNSFPNNGIVVVASNNNTITGNFLINNRGTSGGGNGVTLDVGSSNNVIGGRTPDARNVISGNHGSPGGHGVGIGLTIPGGVITGPPLFSPANTNNNFVQGNFIGLSADGSTPAGNQNNGVFITNAATFTQIGGAGSGAGNIISANSGNGIFINNGATQTLIRGNYIGTDVGGSVARGNGGGVSLTGASQNSIGTTDTGGGNVISANVHSGISIFSGSTLNAVQANRIGTDPSGTLNLGNQANGVIIGDYASNNQIGGASLTTPGGPCTGACNLIVSNAFQGVLVRSGTGNRISRNSIFANSELGIHLLVNDVDQNFLNPVANDNCDADTGGNKLQNYPILNTLTSSGGSTTVAGNLNSTPNTTFTIEFFANSAGDPSGSGQGQTFIGSKTVTTDGSCNVDFNVSLPIALSSTQVVTATATDPSGNTSEFSPWIAVGTTLLGLSSVTPNKGGNQDAVTATVVGQGIKPGATVKLTTSGQPDIVGTNVTVATNGASLTATFNLNGQTAGVRDLIVTNTNGKSATLPGAFTVLLAAPGNVNFVTAWGSFGTNNGQFRVPWSVAVDSSGNVYVADTGKNSIQKFTSTGIFITTWGSSGSGNGQFSGPYGLAIDSSGNIYVADTANDRIQKFTSTGIFITTWGSIGSGNGQFISPKGLAIDSSGNIYVADQGNDRIQKFTSTGTFITKWGSFNADGIAVDSSGNLYVLDIFHNRIQKFTSTGIFITTWGSRGSGNGQFISPYGLAIDSSGNIYVADGVNCRIQKFTSTGIFITTWGSRGSGNGQFILPTGVAVDSSGNVYVADNNNRRVQKFGPNGPNHVPVANAGPNQTIQSTGATTAVTLNGTASSEPDGDPLFYAWSEGTTVLGQGATLNVSLPSGIHTITLAVTDPFLASSTANVTVKIADMLSTPAGSSVTVSGSTATVSYSSVTTSGTTTVTPISPSGVVSPSGPVAPKGSIGAESLPSGYLLTSTSQAFSVTTDAIVQPPIDICFDMSVVTDATAFAHLAVLHDEGGTLVDQTTSRNFDAKTVCTEVNSLGNFVIATTPTFQIQFKAIRYSVDEGAGFATIDVEQMGDQVTPVSVDYATSDDTGQQRKDYTLAAGTLNFRPGEMTKTFTVLVTDNVFIDGSRKVNLSLSNPSTGMTLGTPSQPVLTIIDNDTVPPTTNPLDNADAQFFVTQHYYDFLSRLPDPGGFDFWTNEITSCGADQQCTEVKRINVSAAFFLSIEFQQTGYLVERIYKASYGDATGTSTFGGAHSLTVPIVRFNEFLPDTQQIGQGVVVGQTGWETVLENNKQAFTLGFVQRSRFTTAFPTSMTPAQFVDKLFLNAGVTPSGTDRTNAINEFSGAADTSNVTARSKALRDAAENATLNQQEFNRAFVLMQYFGYLRRNPNDPQDTDYSGYDFWLSKLNNFTQPGDDVLVRVQKAEMVKAFIVSSEYRNRFGP
jgi:sugar lactone lactonase YvrE